MNWERILTMLWHGISAAGITAGTAIVAMDGWPTSWGWVVLGAGAGIAFFRGVSSYGQEPK